MNYYKNRLCLNCLTKDIENALEIYEAMDKNAVIGVLSGNYPNFDEALSDMKKYQAALENNISIGLGAGNPAQGLMVAALSGALKPNHVNQVFPYVGITREKVSENDTHINALVSPSGIPGLVKISTGPESTKLPDGNIPVETAIALVKEMGGNSLKFFPMGGLKTIEEFKLVAKACGKSDFILEPTGGIDLENIEEILKICIEENVPKVIVHVYSSIIDKESGKTKITDVKRIKEIFEKLL